MSVTLTNAFDRPTASEWIHFSLGGSACWRVDVGLSFLSYDRCHQSAGFIGSRFRWLYVAPS